MNKMKKSMRFSLVLIMVFYFGFCESTLAPAELNTMYDFKVAWHYLNVSTLTTWSDPDPCNWIGIVCSGSSVVQINRVENSGNCDFGRGFSPHPFIPESVGNLT